MAKPPVGRLMKKHHRQEACWESAPPIIGPITLAMAHYKHTSDLLG
jgi:hypothetical protein